VLLVSGLLTETDLYRSFESRGRWSVTEHRRFQKE
jgi:hypothetical protein